MKALTTCSFAERNDEKIQLKQTLKYVYFKITLSLQSQSFQAPNNSYFSISLFSEKALLTEDGPFFSVFTWEPYKSNAFCLVALAELRSPWCSKNTQKKSIFAWSTLRPRIFKVLWRKKQVPHNCGHEEPQLQWKLSIFENTVIGTCPAHGTCPSCTQTLGTVVTKP